MARARKICATAGCPTPTSGGYCAPHQAEAERARGSRKARGYGYEHVALRKQYARYVEAGQVSCSRCDEPIQPGTPWHLDHADDRASYLGPAHARCNVSAAGRKSHRNEWMEDE